MTDKPWTSEISVDSAEELLQVLSPASEYFRCSEPQLWIFRGECDWDEPLQPTLYRKDSWLSACKIADAGEIDVHDTISNESELFHIRVELKLLERFIKRADESGLGIPDYSPYIGYWLRDYRQCVDQVLQVERFSERFEGAHPINSLLDGRENGSWPSMMINSIMALARHNGMPSRLLDWTFSAPTAAYFAVKDYLDRSESGRDVPNSISVWALSRNITGRILGRPKPHPPEFSFIQTPSVGNLHMVAQRGVFTSRIVHWEEFYSECDRRGLQQLLEERRQFLLKKDDAEPEGPYLFRFRVHSGNAEELLWLLAKMGISGNRLFPTYAGVIKSLSEDLYFPH
jgi:hypothetical protein